MYQDGNEECSAILHLFLFWNEKASKIMGRIGQREHKYGKKYKSGGLEIGDFIVSLTLELEDTDKDPEGKVQSMKERFPELETCTPELRMLFNARSLPLIKILSVTIVNAQ